MHKLIVLIAISLIVTLADVNRALSQGTAFTYQGLLTENGNPANGSYELRFRLFNALTDGSQLGGTVTRAPVAVSNGLCTVTVDFGSAAFDGSERWLEIAVRPNGSAAAHALLLPRQAVLPGPYAIHAAFAGGLTGNPTVTGTLTFNPASGAPFVVGNATKVDNLNGDLLDGLDSSAFAPAWHPPNDCPEGCYWKLLGNAGTSAGINFVGTTDNQPLEFKVNGQRALLLQPTTNSPNVIGGFEGNRVNVNAYGVTVGGGGTIGRTNWVDDYLAFEDDIVVYSLPAFATLSGGVGNTIAAGPYCTISGGAQNGIVNSTTSFDFWGGERGANTIGGGMSNGLSSTMGCTIGGGLRNSMGGPFMFGVGVSTIGGGSDNSIEGSSDPTGAATIAGGVSNRIGRLCFNSSIGGGSGNQIDYPSITVTIAGGSRNRIYFGGGGTIGGGGGNLLGGDDATIGGGAYHYVGAAYGTIGGGRSNSITLDGVYGTIPGGRDNEATNYCFAAGRRAKARQPGSFVWGDSTDADIASSTANQFTARASGGVRFFSDSGGTVGVQLSAGGNAWSPLSDRNAKENFETLNCREVLSKLDEMPVTTWNLKSQPASIRHIGPMAQDFKAAFGVGEDDRHISTSDADGVAFAAIKGLNVLLKEKETRIATLEKKAARVEALEANVAELKTLVNALLQKSHGGAQ